MLKAITFVLFLSSFAHAAEYLCSPSPIHVDYKVATTVSKKGVNYGGEQYGFVEISRRQARFKPDYNYTDLRVSANGLQWSIMCVDQAQLAKLREQGYLN